MKQHFQSPIALGTLHRFEVEVNDSQQHTTVNYKTSSDIALHVSIRPARRMVVINKKLGGVWQDETALELTTQDVSKIGQFEIEFVQDGVRIVGKYFKPSEVHFRTKYSTVTELTAPGRIVTVSPHRPDSAQCVEPMVVNEGNRNNPRVHSEAGSSISTGEFLTRVRSFLSANSTFEISQVEKALSDYIPVATDPEFPELICSLVKLERHPLSTKLAKAAAQNVEAIFDVLKANARTSMSLPEALYVHKTTPLSLVGSAPKGPSPVISLTCISTRLERLPATLETLFAQDLSPHSVNLYISSEPHLLDKGIPKDDPTLKKIHAMGANVYHVKNLGPFRKQHPVVAQLHSVNASPSTLIVTVDDDVLYPRDTLRNLATLCDREHCVVAQRGRKMLFSEGKIAAYDSFRIPTSSISHMNLANGRNGIMYKLRFFPKNHELYVGPWLSPTADDLWCKWIMAYYCIPTMITEPKAAFVPSLDFEETDKSDKLSLFHAFNARGKNDIAIESLEAYFGSRLKSFHMLHGGEK
jgi:hypothetical protein